MPALNNAPMAALDPFRTTYNLVINERQRQVIMQALAYHISEGFDEEGDGEFGENTAKSLHDMLNPEGTTGPLAPAPAVNGLVL
jgi:hypothetical protein